MHFTPGAHVALTELDEEDWTVIALPIDGKNFLLAGVNSNERSRADDRVQSVVIYSDISVERIRSIHELKRERKTKFQKSRLVPLHASAHQLIEGFSLCCWCH